MPYQGDRQQPHPKFTTNFAYVKKPPGAFIVVQLVSVEGLAFFQPQVCTSLGFLLAIGSSVVWRVRHGHGFFSFVAFLSMLSCVTWLMLHVFQLDSLIKKDINWNKVGLAYNGINAVLVMVASCFMLDVASEAKPLKAAGVFGFLGFSAFLAGLVWEVIVWRKNRDSDFGFSTATVVRGPRRSRSPESEASLGVAGAEEEGGEGGVGFVGMKARPVSSFLEPSAQGRVTTPMLLPVEGNGSASSDRSSTHSSVQGEWQTPSSQLP